MTATAEVIEGQAKVINEEPAEERALAIVPERQAHLSSGLGAIAAMSDEAFDRNLALLTKAKVRAAQMQKALLTEGVDYGTVPGIPRPFLHKPGAETFEKAYGFATSYEIERKVGDGIKTPEVEYIVHAKVHLGDTDGPIVAEGVGSCNTHETKYRYRSAKRTCPDCNGEGLVKGKADGKLKGKWWCPPNNGGCGHTFEPSSEKGQAIEAQVVGQVENENPWDLANTMLKMARKRAGVDGILTATGTSGLFTQDDDSPAVQRDAQQGGQQQSSGGSRQETSSAPAVKLPAIPPNLAERTSLGTHSLTGAVAIARSGPNDGQLRQAPDGNVLGFRMEFPGGAKVNRVFARGVVADQLGEVLAGNPEAIAGQTVTVRGEVFAVPWKKTNDDGIEEQMPPFREMDVVALTWGELVLPKTEPAAAKPKGSGKAKTTPATTPASTGPGMTTEAFAKALDAGRIVPAFANAKAKELYGAETLDALSDAQRLDLAGELGLLAEEE
jgi:hypothetical protein